MLVISEQDIVLGQSAQDKQEAIEYIANLMIEQELVATGYDEGMLHREQQAATYLDSGIAIPHGTIETRDQVLRTGVQIVQFPDGIIWGDEGQKAYIAIGIAASSDEHLGILKRLTRILGADDLEQQLREATTAEQIANLLNGTQPPPQVGALVFDAALVEQGLHARNLLELIASGCAMLANRQLVNRDFIAQQVTSDPVLIGQGLWLASGEIGVQQSSMALLTVAQPFHHSGQLVNGLLMVASADHATVPALEQLAALICDNRLAELLPSIEDTVALLTGTGIASQIEPEAQGQEQEQLSDPSPESTLEPVVASQETVLEPHTFTIVNSHGLHARPCAILLATIKKFESAIQVANATEGGEYRDARSLVNLMGLGLSCGDQIAVTVEGPDAEAAITAIGNAISNGLGEQIA